MEKGDYVYPEGHRQPVHEIPVAQNRGFSNTLVYFLFGIVALLVIILAYFLWSRESSEPRYVRQGPGQNRGQDLNQREGTMKRKPKPMPKVDQVEEMSEEDKGKRDMINSWGKARSQSIDAAKISAKSQERERERDDYEKDESEDQDQEE